MSEIIAFVIGLVLGAIGGFLAYRNNKARLVEKEHELIARAATIDSLRKQLAQVIRG